MGKPEYPGENKQTFVGGRDINLDEGFTAIKAQENNNNNNNNKRERERRTHTLTQSYMRIYVLIQYCGKLQSRHLKIHTSYDRQCEIQSTITQTLGYIYIKFIRNRIITIKWRHNPPPLPPPPPKKKKKLVTLTKWHTEYNNTNTRLHYI